METLARAWIRVISWRIITTIVGFVILFAMSGQIALSIGFATINAIIQTVFHIVHERLWDRITWGRNDVAKPKRIRRKNQKGQHDAGNPQ